MKEKPEESRALSKEELLYLYRSFIISYKRQLIANAKEEAAVVEYNRIFPCDEKKATAVALLADFVERSMSGFLDKKVEHGFDPELLEFRSHVPMSMLDLKRYIDDTFQDFVRQIIEVSALDQFIDRFVRVCEILKDMVNVSSQERNLTFLYSKPFSDALSLITSNRTGLEGYVSAIDQERMVEAFSGMVEAISALYSSLGYPAGVEEMLKAFPMFRARFKDTKSQDRCFRSLFDGDRSRAVFNPILFIQIKTVVSYFASRSKASGLEDVHTYVKDCFSGKKIYNTLLPAVDLILNVYDNKYKAEEIRKLIVARLNLLKQCMDGSFEEKWVRIRNKKAELSNRLKTLKLTSEDEKRTAESSLRVILDEEKNELQNIDKAGFVLDDLLRGEVVDAKGNRVKIRKLQVKESRVMDAICEDGGKCASECGRTDDYYSKHPAFDIFGGRIVVGGADSLPRDCLKIVNKGESYRITTRSKDFWTLVDSLLEWYSLQMKGCKSVRDKLLKALDLSSRQGRLFCDGKRLRGAMQSLFARGCIPEGEDSPNGKKELLFKFSSDRCKNSNACYISFARDLFIIKD